MKQQLIDYKSVIDANEEKTPEQNIQEQQIETKIESLEKEIEDVKSAFEIQNLILSRMQLSSALKNNMENMITGSSEFMDDLRHILNLNKQIMTSQQESRELETKLLEVRKKRLQLKQASGRMLLEIQTKKNKQKEEVDSMRSSDKIKSMHRSLEMEMQSTEVVQHVFQNLILGSKVNWAEDPALKDIVPQLEKNLNMM